MNDLDVDDQLVAVVVENEDTDAAMALLEGSGEAGVEAGLVNDGEVGPDVAGLGHGSDGAVLDVEHAVLLEHGAEHGLDDDAGGRVGDERGLLVKLLAEQVNTEVTVLAGGRGGGDADDLAGAALEHQDVTHANVVARDGDGVGDGVGAAARAGAGRRGGRARVVRRLANQLIAVAVGVEDAISHFVKTVTKRMIFS